eukprot:TRINITY_DN5438_c0_g1_i1.p1 TRINITY_DN5438_c0_g1~~TRINITY_DN5438_c0_g1_i1.p1  ORF type:complete len:632 (+),score=101.55 TRINITY_DN5438_c0_g1_i1:39-1934(+)
MCIRDSHNRATRSEFRHSEIMQAHLDNVQVWGSLTHFFLQSNANIEDEIEFFMDSERLKCVALSGRIDQEYCGIRSLAWRIFLNVVAGDYKTWNGQLAVHRGDYNVLQNKYSPILLALKIHKEKLVVYLRNKNSRIRQMKQSGGASFNHPLSEGNLEEDCEETVPFVNPNLAQYLESYDQISIDVERISQDKFFQSKKIKDILVRILFIYAHEVSSIGYKQGMHEILATIYFVFYVEAQGQSTNLVDTKFDPEAKNNSKYDVPAPSIGSAVIPKTYNINNKTIEFLQIINNPRFVEHDCYKAFISMMKIVGSFYTAAAPKNGLTPLRQRLDFIQNELLMKLDPALGLHFEKEGIEPQLYGMRWLRLVLTREFERKRVYILWDSIFAFGNEFALLNHIAVSMLLMKRQDLLASDYAVGLKILFHYPPVEEVHGIVRRALELVDIYGALRADDFTLLTVDEKTNAEIAELAKKQHQKEKAKISFESVGDQFEEMWAGFKAKHRHRKSQRREKPRFRETLKQFFQEKPAEANTAQDDAESKEGFEMSVSAVPKVEQPHPPAPEQTTRKASPQTKTPKEYEFIHSYAQQQLEDALNTLDCYISKHEQTAKVPREIAIVAAQLKHIKDVLAGKEQT